MGDTINAAVQAFLIVIPAVNFVAGAYLLCRFIMAQRQGGNTSTIHWSGLWGVGWLVLLAGLTLFLFGGVYLVFLSTVLWVIAAIRCWREPVRQAAALDPHYGLGEEEILPPPPNSPSA